MWLTKWEEIIRGNRAATSIPWTSLSSNPAFRASSESKCIGFESWLTFEYSRTSSFVKILACLKISPVFRTLIADEEKHLTGRTLAESKLLMNIVVEVLKRFLNIVSQIQIEAKFILIFSAKHGQIRGIVYILNDFTSNRLHLHNSRKN